MHKKSMIIITVIIVILILGIVGTRHSENLEEKDNINLIDKSKDDKITKSYIDKDNENREIINHIPIDKAIEICEEKYGVNDDTIYSGEDKIVTIEGKEGYLIQVKSNELISQGGSGILFSVIVSEDGEITEI